MPRCGKLTAGFICLYVSWPYVRSVPECHQTRDKAAGRLLYWNLPDQAQDFAVAQLATGTAEPRDTLMDELRHVARGHAQLFGHAAHGLALDGERENDLGAPHPRRRRCWT